MVVGVGTAICIAKIAVTSATVHGALASGAPLDHVKEVLEALVSGGELAAKLKGPENEKLIKALTKSKIKLERAYSEALKRSHSAGFRETVESALGTLGEVFEHCLPSGKDLMRLRHDPEAIGSWIADRALERDIQVFKDGEGRKILITLVVVAYTSLDRDPTFMALMERMNWSEQFTVLSKLEIDIGLIRDRQQSSIEKIEAIAEASDPRVAKWQPRHRRWELKHAGSLWCSALSSDGKTVAAASDNGMFTVWHVHPQYGFAKLFDEKKNDNEAVWVEFSPDSKFLAVAWKDGGIQCWYADDRELTFETNHNAFLSCVRFSHNGDILASAARDGHVKLWDPQTGGMIRDFSAVQDWGTINYVDFSPDNSRIVTANGDIGEIGIWDVDTGDQLALKTVHRGGSSSAVFSNDGSRIMSVGTSDRKIALLDANTLDTISNISTSDIHKDVVWMASFSSNDQLIVTASDDKTAVLWLADGTLIKRFLHPRSLMTAVFNADSSRVLTSCSNGAAYLWELQDP